MMHANVGSILGAYLCIDSNFELVLPVGEVLDLVEGHLGGVPLIRLPHQLLQLLLLLLSRGQLASQVAVLMRLHPMPPQKHKSRGIIQRWVRIGVGVGVGVGGGNVMGGCQGVRYGYQCACLPR